MAFRCDDCQYIYEKKRTSCPFCGGRVYNDSSTSNALLNAGFTWAPGQSSNGTPNLNPAEHTVANNPFESLRQEFFNEHNERTFSRQEDVPIVHPNTQANSTPSVNQSGADFFSEFDSPPSGVGTIPTIKPQTVPRQLNPAPVRDPYERELQELERQRQREERRYRRHAFLNRFSHIRWATVFRIILIIAIVIAGITIWNMRHVIFNSILNFIISLIPTIIIIWFIWYLLRSLFR